MLSQVTLVLPALEELPWQCAWTPFYAEDLVWLNTTHSACPIDPNLIHQGLPQSRGVIALRLSLRVGEQTFATDVEVAAVPALSVLRPRTEVAQVHEPEVMMPTAFIFEGNGFAENAAPAPATHFTLGMI